jgi:hypothetical protein
LLPKMKAAWRQVAEQTVARLTSTPIDQLTAVLEDLAGSLAASVAPAEDVPRYISRSASIGPRTGRDVEPRPE